MTVLRLYFAFAIPTLAVLVGIAIDIVHHRGVMSRFDSIEARFDNLDAKFDRLESKAS